MNGNLGYSFYYRANVMDIILAHLPPTILLMSTSLLFSSIIGILLGVLSSRKPYSIVDNMIMTLCVVAYSIPVFWLGQMFVMAFSLNLGWLPVQGMFSPRTIATGLNLAIDVTRHLTLPSMTLGLFGLALVTRITRTSMLEIFREDFMLAAHAKGLEERRIIFVHALRNALLPVVTLIGMRWGHMLAGAVLVETIFAWQGIGRLIFESIHMRDYPLVIGVFVVVSFVTILANLVTDLVCVYIDPRIRYK